MKFSRTLTLAVGSAAIVWMVLTYYLQAPPWPALVGAIGALLWIVAKAWRKRPGSSTHTLPTTKKEVADSDQH